MGKLYLFVKISSLTSRSTRRTSNESKDRQQHKGRKFSLRRISIILTILLSFVGLVERVVRFAVYVRELETAQPEAASGVHDAILGTDLGKQG